MEVHRQIHLWRAAQAGDCEAQLQLERFLSGYARAHLARRFGSVLPPDIDDAIQEAWAHWIGRSAFDPSQGTAPTTWFTTLALRAYITLQRKRRPGYGEAIRSELVAPTEGAQTDSERLVRAVEELDDDSRFVFLMRRGLRIKNGRLVFGAKWADDLIGRHLGRDRNYVYRLDTGAQEALRRAIQSRGDTYP